MGDGGEVLPFRPRSATASEDGYDGLRCPDCGCSWFKLGSGPADAFGPGVDAFEPGVVAVDLDGSVTAYSGTPHCMRCGREVLP